LEEILEEEDEDENVTIEDIEKIYMEEADLIINILVGEGPVSEMQTLRQKEKWLRKTVALYPSEHADKYAVKCLKGIKRELCHDKGFTEADLDSCDLIKNALQSYVPLAQKNRLLKKLGISE